MIQNNLPRGALPPRTPDTTVVLEVAYSNGGLTGSAGHVVQLHERILARGGMKPFTKTDLDGLAFFVLDRPEDLERKWPAILAGEPDFIKLYLGFSEEHAKSAADPAWFGRRGLDPALVPLVVRRAHGARLRVSAHIETAADFGVAVQSDVDIVAHLPGWRIGTDAGFDGVSLDRWRIRDEDARTAAREGIVVVTTTLAGKGAIDPKNALQAEYRELHRQNLATLLRNGVQLVIGSDYYEGTALAEALFLGKQPLLGSGIEPLGVLDNLEILRLWSQDTPRVIFPGRKLGRLAEGFEASFLVLDGDPIEDLGNVRRVRLRVKNGALVPNPP